MDKKKQVFKFVRVSEDVHYKLLVAAVKAKVPVHKFASEALELGVRKLSEKQVPVQAKG